MQVEFSGHALPAQSSRSKTGKKNPIENHSKFHLLAAANFIVVLQT